MTRKGVPKSDKEKKGGENKERKEETNVKNEN